MGDGLGRHGHAIFCLKVILFDDHRLDIYRSQAHLLSLDFERFLISGIERVHQLTGV